MSQDSEAQVDIVLHLALVAEHLEVHLVFLVQPGDVLPADLSEVFACNALTGSSAPASRTSVDSALPLPRLLVDASQAVPVRPQSDLVRPR